MLFATQHKLTAEAVKYFDKVLATGDYYLGTEVKANWNGHTADILGLDKTRPVTRAQFKALLSGKHPITGKNLVQRMRKDRRPGTDFTLSVPKSYSVLWAINKDERLLELLKETVRETFEADIEPLVHRRVRDGDNVRTDNRKKTGNLVYADFAHLTSRPVNGVPCPHLHVHAFVANVTEDNGKFFAADNTEIMRQLPLWQASFDARLARKLETQLGLQVHRTTYTQSGRRKTGWEIKGISRATIEKFSRRTAQIEAYAKANGITSAEAKSLLGKRLREAKDSTLSLEELRKVWLARLSPQEREAFAALRAGEVGIKLASVESERLDKAADFALEHHLFRQSTVEKHKIVGTALEHGLTFSRQDVEAKLEERGVIQRSLTVDGAKRDFITTREVLEAEQAMISFARNGQGTRYALGSTDHIFKRAWLNDQQRDAINHVLRSRDTVSVVMGGAGVGKTSTMKEAAEAIEANNKQVFCFAPSTGAKDVLHEEGFKTAETVEHLIRNEKLHAEVSPGDVLWIDEASLLDVRSMTKIFGIAEARKARVVLSGDTRQHSSPRRGEAMRLLLSEAGLNAARIDKIQRQKGQYKQAVELISRGHEMVTPTHTGLEAGFDMLNKLGKIKELGNADRHKVLASHYLANRKRDQSTLVVAPTHAEGQNITNEIREQLKKAGAVGTKEWEVPQLRSLNMTEAEKGEATSYSPGQVVQFHQNAKGGFKRGDRYRVQLSNETDVMLVPVNGDAKPKPLPVAVPDRFEVYSEGTVRFSKGDKIRFSLGGLAKDGKRRVSNGRLDEISSFDRWGNIRLKSGMTISSTYAHLDMGYCITSHAAQGKTTKSAICAMGSQSLPAINAKQFYVTTSRGSEDVAIYVDDKKKVRRAIQEAGHQLSATELVQKAAKLEHKPAAAKKHRQRHAFLSRVREWWKTHRPGQGASVGQSIGLSPPSNPNLSR